MGGGGGGGVGGGGGGEDLERRIRGPEPPAPILSGCPGTNPSRSTARKDQRGQADHHNCTWVVCFNSFMSVLAVRQPYRIHNLLAYSSMITNAYEGNL